MDDLMCFLIYLGSEFRNKQLYKGILLKNLVKVCSRRGFGLFTIFFSFIFAVFMIDCITKA